MRIIDLTNQRFERLTVIGRAENTSQGQARWNCRCDCGNSVTVASVVLRDGRSRSCGCLKVDMLTERSTKHGHANSGQITPTYHSWAGMIARCRDKKHRSFKNYGGRGITVCDRWGNFQAFLEDMGEKPSGMSIDRINGSGNYEPGNCRWATANQQARNKRNNVRLLFNGEEKTAADWAEIAGISAKTITERILAGWSVEESLTVPAKTPENDPHSRFLTHNGQTHTIAEWSRILDIPATRIYMRVHRGDSDSRALR